MTSERRPSGAYHLTGSQLVEKVDDLSSGGRWEELNRRAHHADTGESQQQQQQQQQSGSKAPPDRSQSFRPYNPSQGGFIPFYVLGLVVVEEMKADLSDMNRPKRRSAAG